MAKSIDSFIWLLLLMALTTTSAFTLSPPTARRSIRTFPQRQQRPLFSSSDNDDEIADLEEKLRQLKIQKKREAEEASIATTTTTTISAVDASTSLKTPKVTNTPEPMLEMLSESWKEGEASDKSSSPILTIALTVVGIVALVAFSQVPVGQEDLSKYSSAKSGSQKIDLGDLNREVRKATEGL
mmetsp:Transcript_18484/g.27922  ORF Transcript_18484/g.27922 Transcript_18484/m.27922 type:complete len:184 (-) Transcript_18484:203-754(-)